MTLTKDEIEQIRDLRRKNVPYREIVKITGRPFSTCQKYGRGVAPAEEKVTAVAESLHDLLDELKAERELADSVLADLKKTISTLPNVDNVVAAIDAKVEWLNKGYDERKRGLIEALRDGDKHVLELDRETREAFLKWAKGEFLKETEAAIEKFHDETAKDKKTITDGVGRAGQIEQRIEETSLRYVRIRDDIDSFFDTVSELREGFYRLYQSVSSAEDKTNIANVLGLLDRANKKRPLWQA